jgi:LasA protease
MHHRFRTFLALILAAIITTSCATSGYWIPPSAPYGDLSALGGTSQPDGVVQPAVTPLPSAENTPILNQDPSPGPEITAEPTQVIEGEVELKPTRETPPEQDAPILYYAQAADSLPVVAARFSVEPGEITSPDPIPESTFINPGQLLVIPRRLAETAPAQHLLPDSEVVYSPSATDFDVAAFMGKAGGKLRNYREWLKTSGTLSGAEVVNRVAIENSINPRVLLALLEYQSGWVNGQPADQDAIDYPMGYKDPSYKDLYKQLAWVVDQLGTGYYAYREGRLTEITFPDGSTARLAPDLNAGTAALQYFFSRLYNPAEWQQALDPVTGFPALYEGMFGSPWERAKTVEPLFPPGMSQPSLSLPFARNWTWSYTGGPHGAWEKDGAYAALDFAPGSDYGGCIESNAWVLASAAGLVVRSGKGVVVLDLDGDGHEQTGWVLVYLHVSSNGKVPTGTWVDQDDPLGHPSCEGGHSTGTHVHVARKYNGEWIPADGPLPFNLGGWVAHAGEEPYLGTLTRDGQTITACTCSNAASFVTRNSDDP